MHGRAQEAETSSVEEKADRQPGLLYQPWGKAGHGREKGRPTVHATIFFSSLLFFSTEMLARADFCSYSCGKKKKFWSSWGGRGGSVPASICVLLLPGY